MRAVVARLASRPPRAHAAEQYLSIYDIAACPARTVRLPGRARSQERAHVASVAQLFSAGDVQSSDAAAAARYAWR